MNNSLDIVIPTYNRMEKLKRLIESIYKQKLTNCKINIIVIDDYSDYDINDLKAFFPNLNIIKNSKKKWVSSLRNQGLNECKSEYVFFLDDDNVLDPNCIQNLVTEISHNPKIGLIAPLMYYYKEKDVIWCAGISRSYYTSVTKYHLRDTKFFLSKNITFSEDFPNAYLTRTELAKSVGGFDDFYFPIHYEESDFAKKIIKKGYKTLMTPKAITYHDVANQNNKSIFEYQNPQRIFYTMRNRILFHRRYGSLFENLILFTVFIHLINFYYLIQLIKAQIKNKNEYYRAFFYGIAQGFFMRLNK